VAGPNKFNIFEGQSIHRQHAEQYNLECAVLYSVAPNEPQHKVHTHEENKEAEHDDERVHHFMALSSV